MVTHYLLCSFDSKKSKFDFYKSEDSMKNFCVKLKEHATNNYL